MSDKSLAWIDLALDGECTYMRYGLSPSTRRVYLSDGHDGTYQVRYYCDDSSVPAVLYGPFDTLEAAKLAAEMIYHAG